jgi:glycosyltransferase involved in cell wall biosynthesis
MARPVIVSDHGGQRETVIEGETGTRAEPGSIESLAACLRALVNMPKSARDGMGQSGQSFVREVYSIEKLKRATLDVYLDVLNAQASVEN